MSIIAGLKLLIGAVNAAGQLPAGAAKVIADSILIRMKQGGFHTAAEMYTKALTGDPTWAQ